MYKWKNPQQWGFLEYFSKYLIKEAQADLFKSLFTKLPM
jgi:hypothetical protein